MYYFPITYSYFDCSRLTYNYDNTNKFDLYNSYLKHRKLILSHVQLLPLYVYALHCRIYLCHNQIYQNRF